MHKTKHSKPHNFELDPKVVAAIDRTVEAALLSRLENLDQHITQTIRACIASPQTQLSSVKEKSTYCPDAGP